jgi:hypothetical protein
MKAFAYTIEHPDTLLVFSTLDKAVSKLIELGVPAWTIAMRDSSPVRAYYKNGSCLDRHIKNYVEMIVLDEKTLIDLSKKANELYEGEKRLQEATPHCGFSNFRHYYSRQEIYDNLVTEKSWRWKTIK